MCSTMDNGGKRAETMSEWSMDPTAPFALYGGGPEMYGKTIGQIGFGMIGPRGGKAGQGPGYGLLVYDPYVSQEQMDYLGAKKTDLDTLMKTADFISINCNVVPETVGLISQEKIALMKPTAYLVNTARAKILDYDALYDALAEKKIAGAGLTYIRLGAHPGGGQDPLLKEHRADAPSGRVCPGYRGAPDRHCADGCEEDPGRRAAEIYL